MLIRLLADTNNIIPVEYKDGLIYRQQLDDVIGGLIQISSINPKSVIRISLCRTAKRNPLIFPI